MIEDESRVMNEFLIVVSCVFSLRRDGAVRGTGIWLVIGEQVNIQSW